MTTETTLTNVGDKLRNGATVIAVKETGRNSEGPLGIVLAYWRNNPVEYVTWDCRLYDGECFNGHYIDNIVDAANDFQMRVDRELT